MVQVGPTKSFSLCNGRYQVFDSLSVDDFAVVYRAMDTRLGAERAVRILHPMIASDTTLVGRFLDEARLLAGIDHPNIPSIHDLGREDDSVYFVTDRNRGFSADSRLAASGAFEAPEALRVTFMALQALATAHQLGVIHRDVRPGNVWLASDGRVWLAGFALARLDARIEPLTRPGDAIGQAPFSSPEQREDPHVVTPHSDLYSAGALLFALVTGRPPPSHGDALADEDLDGVPTELRRLLGRAMHPIPNARFADAREMAVAVAGAYDTLAEGYGRPLRGDHLMEEFDLLLARRR